MGTHQPRPESKVHGRTGSVSRLWEGTLIGAVQGAACVPKTVDNGPPRPIFAPEDQTLSTCPGFSL